jgi:anti-sigma B factor antagonist
VGSQEEVTENGSTRCRLGSQKGNRGSYMKIKIALLTTMFLFAVLASASTALTSAQARPEKPLNQAAANALVAELTIGERQAGDVTILDLEGKITDGGGATALRNAIRGLLDKGKRKILLNFKGVSHVGDDGIGAMIYGHTEAKSETSELKFVNLSNSLKEVLVITKLLTVFDTYADEAEALNSFK